MIGDSAHEESKEGLIFISALKYLNKNFAIFKGFILSEQ